MTGIDKSKNSEERKNITKEISKELKENLEKIWLRKSASARFQELEGLMDNLAQQKFYIMLVSYTSILVC